jgi:hypothetical protein
MAFDELPASTCRSVDVCGDNVNQQGHKVEVMPADERTAAVEFDKAKKLEAENFFLKKST